MDIGRWVVKDHISVVVAVGAAAAAIVVAADAVAEDVGALAWKYQGGKSEERRVVSKFGRLVDGEDRLSHNSRHQNTA